MFIRKLVTIFVLISPALGRIEYITYRTPIQNLIQPGSSSMVCGDGYNATKCDGKVECLDRADEDRDTCYDHVCKKNQFKCAYGACLPQRKVCNGRVDCEDGSDELLPYCRNATRYNTNGVRGFVCNNRQRIRFWEVCDGRQHCMDGSDEHHQLCGNSSCHRNQVQCLYGACLYNGTPCDGVPDCADGSDESFMYCGTNQCRREEFRCAYGGCVNETKLCGDQRACLDHSDLQDYCESEYIYGGFFHCPYDELSLIKVWKVCDGEKNCPSGGDETEVLCGSSSCHSNQFKCKYGACLRHGSSCDGIVHCFDGSDETEELCSSNQCNNDQFRCGYGACISKDDVCDGKRDCADGSDEDHLLCQQNHCSDELQFQCGYGACVKLDPCVINEKHYPLFRCNQKSMKVTSFKCQTGVRIHPQKMCDGNNDCADKSDEEPVLCRNLKRRFCNNSTCIYDYSTFACDGNWDCADGSDESAELCETLRCVVPPAPEHGHYDGMETTKPGDFVKTLTLKVICDKGYTVNGLSDEIICNGGYWSVDPLPKCVRYCTLESDPNISYRCVDAGAASEDSRACRPRELAGARALPACGGPAGPALAVPYMTCGADGVWDHMPNCTTECGLVTQLSRPLVAQGRVAERCELPWYTGVYTKESGSYSHICGGSLVSEKLVISAAHCFWQLNVTLNKVMQLSEENYAVSVGNVYRQWKHPEDVDAQWSTISKIVLPGDYEGFTKNQQSDIAMVVLTNPVEYRPHIRPICLNFDKSFEEEPVGRMGKVAGWGYTTADGILPEKLRTVELPYVDKEECNRKFPYDFKGLLTMDKFCVGYLNRGISLCKGDSGSGIAFPETFNGEERYFLRGVASTAPKKDGTWDICNVNIYSTMTKIGMYEDFIKQHL